MIRRAVRAESDATEGFCHYPGKPESLHDFANIAYASRPELGQVFRPHGCPENFVFLPTLGYQKKSYVTTG
jgi:hypothetical protein